MDRTVIAYGACLLLLSACGRAIAERANSHNPAHCLAAYNYAHLIYRRGPNPDRAAALNMNARTTFESLKLDKAGDYPVALSQAGDFARKHGADQQMMMDLLAKCEADQDADPEYRIALKDGSLLATARRLEHR